MCWPLATVHTAASCVPFGARLPSSVACGATVRRCAFRLTLGNGIAHGAVKRLRGETDNSSGCWNGAATPSDGRRRRGVAGYGQFGGGR